MKRIIRKKYLFLAVLIAALVIPGIFKAQTNGMKRVDDPIVVEGVKLKSLCGSPIDRLALMASKAGAWAPIPFQIDQKKPDGSYAFTSGPEASQDPDPNLDDNDELVFMVKDTGDRVEDGKWPAGAEAGVEIEALDPKDGGKGWLYLIRFKNEAPRSKEDYIRVEIDQKKKRRMVVTYEYAMGGPMDRIYPDFVVRIKPDGSMGLDVLDRLKMRGKIVLVSGISIPFNMDELTRARDRGYIDGPVRVLHLADGYLELASYLKLKGTGYSCISYYVNHMIWPMYIEVPLDLKIIKRIDFYGFMDFTPNVYGSYPFNATNPINKDVVLDGHMSEAEKNLNLKTPIEWYAGFGPQGAIVNRLFFKPKLNYVQKLPYYVDDATLKDPPEDNPGVSGVGYSLVGMEKGSQPNTMVYIYFYFKSELKPQDVYKILDILDNPVQIKVSNITI